MKENNFMSDTVTIRDMNLEIHKVMNGYVVFNDFDIHMGEMRFHKTFVFYNLDDLFEWIRKQEGL